MYLILLIIVVIFLVKFFSDRFQPKYIDGHENPYQIRSSVINKSEEAFFAELTRVLPDNFHVFPKVRIADILKNEDGPGSFFSGNRILSNHVDLLICDPQFRPQVAIEVNGIFSDRAKTAESDELKKQVFEEVGFPFKIVKVGESFSEAIQEILASVNNLPTP
jgi:hypothetical protein